LLRKGWIKSKVDVYKLTFGESKSGKKKFLLVDEADKKDEASVENTSKDSLIKLAEDNNAEADGDRESMTDAEVAAAEKESEGELENVDQELVDVNADVADLGDDAESDAIDEEFDDDDNEPEEQDELAAENDDLPIEQEGGIESEEAATEEPESEEA